MRIATATEVLDGATEAAFADLAGQVLESLQMVCRDVLGDLEDYPYGLRARGADLIVEPAEEGGVPQRILRQPHEQACGLALRCEGKRGADDPPVDVLQQIVPLGGRQELSGEDLLTVR